MFQKQVSRTINAIIITLVAITVLLVSFIGCGVEENNPITPSLKTTTPGSYTSAAEVLSIIKQYNNLTPRKTQALDILMAPSSGNWEKTKEIDDDGVRIKLYVPGVQDPVKFIVPEDSLDDDDYDDMTITMKLFLAVDNNELVSLFFEFGPAGIQFNPAAKLKIPFELLMTEQVDTFVITDENGDEIDGVSYDIDYNNECLITYIPHFSYYYYERR